MYFLHLEQNVVVIRRNRLGQKKQIVRRFSASTGVSSGISSLRISHMMRRKFRLKDGIFFRMCNQGLVSEFDTLSKYSRRDSGFWF